MKCIGECKSVKSISKTSVVVECQDQGYNKKYSTKEIKQK